MFSVKTSSLEAGWQLSFFPMVQLTGLKTFLQWLVDIAKTSSLEARDNLLAFHVSAILWLCIIHSKLCLCTFDLIFELT